MTGETQAGEWVAAGPRSYAARWYGSNDRAAAVYAMTAKRWAWWAGSPVSGVMWTATGDGCATKEEAMAAADAWLRERGYLPAEPELEPEPEALVPSDARRRYKVVLNTDPAWHDFDRLWDVVDDAYNPIAQRMTRWAAELLAAAVGGA